ncbi:MAG TPA: hypothetical protein VGH33_12495, partial [Isosphaeraceae bacterium]
MPIPVACRCGKTFEVPDHFAGKSGRCKTCGQALMIPEEGVELLVAQSLLGTDLDMPSLMAGADSKQTHD